MGHVSALHYVACVVAVTSLLCGGAYGSYLDATRFHFNGTFYCDVSTLNNFIVNYDPANEVVPWWDPNGLSIFRFDDVTVTSAFGQDEDCAVGAQLMSSGNGKMVDIDPDNQFQPQLYGVDVSLSLGTQQVFKGKLALAEMQGQWMRALTTPSPDNMLGNDTIMRAGYWQSVLSDVTWFGTPPSCSPTLQKLFEVSNDLLSIKFNLDNYDNRNFSDTFRIGRITGTIGPHVVTESRQHVTNGRILWPVKSKEYEFSRFVVDEASSTLTMDLGNSVRTLAPGGESVEDTLEAAILVDDHLQFLKHSNANTSKRGLEHDANIDTLSLTSEELETLRAAPLVLVDSLGQVVLREESDGRYAFFSHATSRLEAGESVEFTLHVYEFGRPVSGLPVPVGYRPSPMKANPNRMNNEPADGVAFADELVTDANGSARLLVTASELGDKLPQPRQYIDSQIYFIGNSTSVVETGFVSVLVFNHHPAPTGTVDWDEAFPYFDLYGRLFPTMNFIVNLTDETTVRRQGRRIMRTLDLDIMDPGYMPVSRDLSQYGYEIMRSFIMGAKADWAEESEGSHYRQYQHLRQARSGR